MSAVALMVLMCMGLFYAQVPPGTVPTSQPDVIRNTAQVWTPQPAAAESPVRPARVRIVDFGTDFLRDGDGRPRHQFHVHRYALEKDPVTGLYKPNEPVKQDHTFDVSGRGRPQDDVVAYHEFSQDQPFSPVAPWYDTLAGTPVWYGGAAVFHANLKESGFTEDGVNQEHDGPIYLPRDNWALFRETFELESPFRVYGLWFWKKPNFLNGGADYRVTFDEQSELALYLQRYFMGIDGVRFLVQDGEQMYLSEQVFKGASPDNEPGSGLGKQHLLCPLKTNWARYDPKAPYRIDFDAAKAKFEKHEFQDVRAVGFYVYRDQLISGYFGFKWYAFEADAVVHRKIRPSEHLNMVKVPAVPDVPEFYLGNTEVPYELWRNVYRLARSNTFVRDPRGYNFIQDGDMGSMAFAGVDGRLLSHGPDEPATQFTLYDAALWCNALSEQESRTPCYYEDPAFKTVFREAIQSPVYVKKRGLPSLYVKWDADGYRLPTPAEWQTAWQAGGNRPATVKNPPPHSTAPVGSSAADALSLYDLAGNVWEMVWPYGNVFDPAHNTSLTVLGGDFRTPQNPADASASPWGDTPFDGSYNIGVRVVRREAGKPAPGAVQPAGDLPQWTIQRGEKTKANEKMQALPQPLVETVPIPGQSAEMAKYETTYARWKLVRDWAVAHGYRFDHDGDMGSMDYWGMRDGWGAAHAHSPNEPVTDLTLYDAMVWCNALSEIEGRTPVYYADSACTQPYKAAFVYRPLQMLFFEAEKADKDGLIQAKPSLAFSMPYVKADADGYRLPGVEEYAAAMSGGQKFKYGIVDDIREILVYAWMFDNSEGTTHPVGQKKPNALGIYDLCGNVSEMGPEYSVKWDVVSGKGHVLRMGGSFLDLALSLSPGKTPPFSPAGWGYPDIGFRVVRQIPRPGTGLLPVSGMDRFARLLVPFVLTASEPAAEGKASSKPAKADRKANQETVQTDDFTIDTARFDPLAGRVFRANLERTGAFSAPAITALPALKWKFATGGPVKSSPVVVDGIAYFGSGDKNIYAVDVKTGQQVWKAETKGPVTGSAAVVDGVVYIASEDGRMYALDSITGQEKWTVRFSQAKPAGSPAVAYGVVFISTGNKGGSEACSMTNGPTVGLDAKTGKKVWQCEVGSQGYGAPALRGSVMIVSNQTWLYGMDLKTAQKQWDVATQGQSRDFVCPMLAGDIAVGIGAMGGNVLAVDVAKGRRLWMESILPGQLALTNDGQLGYEILAAPAVAHGRIYIGGNDGKLHTFDLKDGKRGWAFTAGGPIWSAPAVAAKAVYFGCHDGNLYAVDADQGTLLWKFQAGGRILSSPWPDGNALYFGCDDGHLYALEGKP